MKHLQKPPTTLYLLLLGTYSVLGVNVDKVDLQGTVPNVKEVGLEKYLLRGRHGWNITNKQSPSENSITLNQLLVHSCTRTSSLSRDHSFINKITIIYSATIDNIVHLAGTTVETNADTDDQRESAEAGHRMQTN